MGCSYTKTRWRRAKVLIIDEISMLDPGLFDKLNRVGAVARNSSEPFGGLQVVAFGDFFQLPPVAARSSSSFPPRCVMRLLWRQLH